MVNGRITLLHSHQCLEHGFGHLINSMYRKPIFPFSICFQVFTLYILHQSIKLAIWQSAIPAKLNNVRMLQLTQSVVFVYHRCCTYTLMKYLNGVLLLALHIMLHHKDLRIATFTQPVIYSEIPNPASNFECIGDRSTWTQICLSF